MTRDEEKPERKNLLREGVLRLRSLFLPSEGLHIGENRLVVKKDASGNQDPYWQRQDGTEDNLTGEILFARATSNLTLSTSAQSIVGDGDSSKVRLLLPTIGDWLIAAVCDLNLTVAGAGISFGELFVNDSGTAETGVAVYIPDAAASERATVSQQWKVTTTAVDTPVELKAKKENAGGTALALATHTTLMATRGGGGGTSVASSDHGNLTGLGDAADHDWALLKDGTRAGSTGSAQDFGATGIKADVLAESTADVGVTADGVLLKDSSIAAGGIKFPDAGALTVSTGVITATGTFHSVIPESGTSDEIDTINGGTDGMVLILRPDLDTYLIDLKHGTGNIEIQGETDIRLSNTEEVAWLVYDGTLSKWLVSNPGTAAHTHASAATGGIMANPRLTGYLQFAEDGSAPIPSANTIRLVGLDDGGVTKLYYRASDGTTYGPLVGYTDAEAVTAVKRETHITLAHSVSGVAFSS